MFKNYFTIAMRNLKRNKIFSLINIAGLAIGISASLVIYLIVQHDLSYDQFHKDGDRIYRVVTKIEFPDLTINNSGVPVPTANAMRSDVTGIGNMTHFITVDQKVSVPSSGTQSPAVFRNQKNIVFADEEYFKVFNYTWLAGASQNALKEPFQVVLTQSRAKSYFGTIAINDIPGRQLIYNDTISVTVVGVVKDFELPTDLVFKEFLSRATLEKTGLKKHWNWDEWGSINSSSQLFVKLKNGITPLQIEKQLVGLRNKYREKTKEGDNKDDTRHFLQGLGDIHFNADYDAFEQRRAHRPTMYGLLAVASFLL